jgi:predicted DNA-binding transcriptional regulator AlpA
MSAKAIQQPEPDRRTSPRILSYQDLKDRGIKFSRQWIVHLMKEGKFPKTVMLGQGHSVGFIESEIDAWIEKLIAERDDQAV